MCSFSLKGSSRYSISEALPDSNSVFNFLLLKISYILILSRFYFQNLARKGKKKERKGRKEGRKKVSKNSVLKFDSDFLKSILQYKATKVLEMEFIFWREKKEKKRKKGTMNKTVMKPILRNMKPFEGSFCLKIYHSFRSLILDGNMNLNCLLQESREHHYLNNTVSVVAKQPYLSSQLK